MRCIEMCSTFINTHYVPAFCNKHRVICSLKFPFMVPLHTMIEVIPQLKIICIKNFCRMSGEEYSKCPRLPEFSKPYS